MKKLLHTDGPMTYEIRVKGLLDQKWSEWLDGFTICPQDNGETLMSGTVVDQAALYGLLNKIRDVGLPLLALNVVQDKE